jgi:D-sedoheptulose 7-phosphate isomerase
MHKDILHSVSDAIKAIEILKEKKTLDFIENVAKLIAYTFEKGNKIIIAGNGGSLCDAMHFAEEFSGYYREKRKAFPAICLSDIGLMSCTANDVGYDYVFKRGVEAYGQEDDIFIGLTTSGNSKNIYEAILEAKKRKMKTICFLGKSGGITKGLADLQWLVSDFSTSDRIQEAHMCAIHIIIEMVEKIIFSKKSLHELEPLLR